MTGEREMPGKRNCYSVAARHPDDAICCMPLTIFTKKEHGYAAPETQDLVLAPDRVARRSFWQGIDGGQRDWRGRCINRRRNGSNATLSWWSCVPGGGRGGGGGVIHELDNGRGGTLILLSPQPDPFVSLDPPIHPTHPTPTKNACVDPKSE